MHGSPPNTNQPSKTHRGPFWIGPRSCGGAIRGLLDESPVASLSAGLRDFSNPERVSVRKSKYWLNLLTAHLIPQERQFICGVFNGLGDGNARAMPAYRLVVQEDRPVAGVIGLDELGHFARVQRVDACIAVACVEHDRGVLCARFHVV